MDRPATTIAAGERWPTGELRPALEDLLGAGAIITALGLRDALSPEAAAAAAAWRDQRHDINQVIRRLFLGPGTHRRRLRRRHRYRSRP